MFRSRVPCPVLSLALAFACCRAIAQVPGGVPVNGPGSTYSRTPRLRPSDAARLPYGLPLMARFDLLPKLRDSLCLQDASYDRSGGNGDSGQFYGRKGNVAVLADIQGPGCIYRFWSANAQGQLRIYFDGEATPRIDCPMQDLFLGKVAPFVAPIVGHKSGGWYSFFPMPFQKRCRFEVTDPGSMYYHVQYQRFPDDAHIRTFTRELTAEDQTALTTVLKQWGRLGSPVMNTADRPAPSLSGGFVLSPGASQSFDLPRGATTITQLGAKVAPADRFTLRQVVLRVYWDDASKPGIEAPIGDFFGSGFGDQRFRAMPNAMTDDGYVSYWPMPYRRSARIALENTGSTPVRISLNARTTPLKGKSDWGYFHAQWHRQTTVIGEPFHILQTTGRGHYVGEHTDMQGDRGIWFLEGDEQIYTDGQIFPGIHGTGTEDFYTGGWYFDEGPFNLAYHGCILKQEDMSRVSAYRYQVQDCVPFEKDLKVDIEHGDVNSYPGADYSCVAYWYQTTPDHDWSPIRAEQLTPARFTLAGVTEAETLPWQGGITEVREDRAMPTEVSNGKLVVVSGQDVAFTLNIPQDDVYHLALGQIAMPDSPKSVELALPGGASDPLVSIVTPEPTPAGRWESGGTFRLKPGTQRFGLKVSEGKRLYLDYVRLAPSRKEPGVIEAESLFNTAITSDENALAIQDGNEAWSGFSALGWKPSKPGATLKLPITVAAGADYAVELAVSRDLDTPTVAVKFDDTALATVDLAAKPGTAHYERLAVGRAAGVTPGNHTLTLTYVGAPDRTTPHLTLDYIRLKRSRYPNSLEAESLKVLEAKDGEATHQDMHGFGADWSGDDQFWFLAQKENAEATLEMPVLKDGSYRLSAYYTTARDYAIVQVLVDGQPVGAPTDTYTENVLAKGKTELGTVSLTAGSHRLTFRVVGKNARSTGYLVGVDAIGLEPTQP